MDTVSICGLKTLYSRLDSADAVIFNMNKDQLAFIEFVRFFEALSAQYE
jgi:hypothetical protein